MNSAFASLAGMAIISLGVAAFLYMRLRKVAGSRERAFLDRTILLTPICGAAFGLLLWAVAAATHASPGVLFGAMFPVFFLLPVILLGRRLRQLRKEDAAS